MTAPWRQQKRMSKDAANARLIVEILAQRRIERLEADAETKRKLRLQLALGDRT